MEYKQMAFNHFITQNTIGTTTLVDLGAGLFERLAWADSSVQQRIGIEIWQPYIDNARCHNCIKIQGDIRNYRELLLEYEMDTALMMDVLEHLPMEDGVKLVNDLKEDFRKIIIIMPCGKFPQDQDLLGHENHEYQTHKSSWYEEDFEKLNFGISIIDKTFHLTAERVAKNEDVAAFFGVWEK
jgi:hypothetical protein